MPSLLVWVAFVRDRDGLPLTIGWLFLSGLAAQEKPYQEGDVDAFLRGARGEGRPAVVLFNFDEKSG